jgi:PKD repeat protein
MFAEGPSGTAQSMSARISPAYPGASVGSMGDFNAGGDILASVSIGRSSRVVRLTPVGPCVANCVVVATLSMVGQFIQDPQNPGSCFQGGSMYNRTTATLHVTNESGVPLGAIRINGRFLDDYWTNGQVTGLTDAAGNITFVHQGLCGVGAIAFFVDGATAVGRTLDRTRGTLMGFVIPTVAPPPPPTNLPPVPRFRISCNSSTRACTFNGTNSSDDVAVTAWQWTFGDGTSGSGTTASHTYAVGGTYPVTLTVLDSAGLSASLTKSVSFAAPPNQPPVAAWSVSCLPAPAHTCTFDGSASNDPDGSIVSYTWTNAGGSSLSTAATFTRSFKRSATVAITLTVTDNGGLTTSLTKNVTVP